MCPAPDNEARPSGTSTSKAPGAPCLVRAVRRTGEFNLLSPEEVDAVARAEPSELCAAIDVTAAFAGLHMGELRALR